MIALKDKYFQEKIMKTLTEILRENMNVLNENFDWKAYANQHPNESIQNVLASAVAGQADPGLLTKLANYFEEGFHGTFIEMIEEIPIVMELGGPDTDEGTEAGYAYYLRALEIFLLNSRGETDPEKLKELAEHLKNENTDVNFVIPFDEIGMSIDHLDEYNY